jgi:hypothetical protein
VATYALSPVVRIPLKQGDSFILGCSAADEQGQPLDLTDYAVTSQARQAGRLVADLVVEFVNRPLGEFEIRAPGDSTTPSWPVGPVEVDIQYQKPGLPGLLSVSSTETFVVDVQKGVTQP